MSPNCGKVRISQVAKCYCGCGRKVGLSDRGLNKQGRRAVKLVGRLRAARRETAERGPLTEGGEVEPLLESLDELIEEGEGWENFWANCIHDDTFVLIPAEDRREAKAEWVKWGQTGMHLASLLELPPKTQIEVARRSREKRI